jgi:hypothetical protein
MNKNIKLAVAGAVLALSATANAGIIIPAGDWTLDVNGNVNAFANYTRAESGTGTAATNGTACTVANLVCGGLAGTRSANSVGQENKQLGINTGLLPSWLGFTGTTRQNDVDVSLLCLFNQTFLITQQRAMKKHHYSVKHIYHLATNHGVLSS